MRQKFTEPARQKCRRRYVLSSNNFDRYAPSCSVIPVISAVLSLAERCIKTSYRGRLTLPARDPCLYQYPAAGRGKEDDLFLWIYSRIIYIDLLAQGVRVSAVLHRCLANVYNSSIALLVLTPPADLIPGRRLPDFVRMSPGERANGRSSPANGGIILITEK
jgi:hypothetical protein